MRFTDENGQTWEFRGEYRTPAIGEYYLQVACCADRMGPMVIIHPSSDKIEKCIRAEQPVGARAVIYPVHKRHTFGGVVFEETGERRRLQYGEWGVEEDVVFPCCTNRSLAEYLVLRPIAVEGAATVVTSCTGGSGGMKSAPGGGGS